MGARYIWSAVGRLPSLRLLNSHEILNLKDMGLPVTEFVGDDATVTRFIEMAREFRTIPIVPRVDHH